MIDLWIQGTPVAQPRPQVFSRGGVKSDHDRSAAWKRAVAMQARHAKPSEPISEPIAMDLEFHFPRPQSLMRKIDPDGRIPHGKRPDSDNLAKAVLDALGDNGWWTDDSLVARLTTSKFYTSRHGEPGLHLRLSTIDS